MPLSKRPNTLFNFTLAFILLVFALGYWWLTIIFKLGEKVQNLQVDSAPEMARLFNMMKWEGVTFFLLLLGIGVILTTLYFRDRKKTRALQDFFASLTHELKTPLASVRLQSEVIKEHLSGLDNTTLSNLSNRLIEDAEKLELELEKILQLSRIERGGQLCPRPLDLKKMLQEHMQTKQSLEWELTSTQTYGRILADTFALELIIKNLVENVKNHVKKPTPKLFMQLYDEGDQVVLEAWDNGLPFKGEIKKIATLFYKFDSPKGSGIGLYLVKRLLNAMGGNLSIQADPGLRFYLRFKKAEA